MQEIKFRGLDKNKNWVYGDLIQTLPHKDGYVISWIQPRTILGLGAVSTPTTSINEVNTESVGQFTGLQDKNGVDMYKGDAVTAHQFLFDGNEIESVIFGVIGSNDFGWTLSRIKNKFYEDYTGYEPHEGESNLGDFYGLHEESFEVIGNDYENPDLITSIRSK